MEVNRETNQTYSQFLDELRASFRFQANYYRHEDPKNITMGVFAEAAEEALETSDFESNVRYVFDIRSNIKPEHMSRLMLRAYQADLLSHDPTYPTAYQSTEKWRTLFEDISHDDARSERIIFNLATKDVQSNIAERYKTIKLLVGLYGERFTSPPSLLDVGSSVLHGGKKLVYNRCEGSHILSFEPVEFVKTSGTEQEYDHPERLRIDERSTLLANFILEREIEFGPVLGVDITNVDDPVIKAWAKSCSFYPDELMDKIKVLEYDLLDKLDPNHRRVRFLKGDFSKAQRRDFISKSPVKEFDIVMFSTVLYQADADEAFRMTVNAMNLVSPNGLIIIQDAPDGNFTQPYNYRTKVYDMTDKTEGWQEILRWESGRCRRLGPALGHISVNGMDMTVSEALEFRAPPSLSA